MAYNQWSGHDRDLPSDWPERRAECFRVYGDICHVCGEPGSTDVDHTGDRDDHRIEVLRPIHGIRTAQRCHVYKSSAEGGRAKADKQGRMKRPQERHPGLR
jgi:hypothetical protein